MTIALIVGLARDMRALDPDRSLNQYLRDVWGSERGFPGGPVYSITQGADGYLWIGADKGLVRFDGLSFTLFEPSGVTEGAGPTVFGVAAAPDGSVWARLRGPALVRYRDGKLANILSEAGLPDTVVTAMVRGAGDVFLLSTLGQGTYSYENGKFVQMAGPRNGPTSSFVISMARTADGETWLGTRDAGLLRVGGASVVRLAAGLPDLKINSLLASAEGGLWIGTDKGVARWTGTEITREGIPPALHDVTALAMTRDRHGNVWVAAGSKGLLRVGPGGSVLADDRDPRSGAVSSIFEDRDGNLWVGTSKGIERLRDGVFTTYTVADGLPYDSAGPVYLDPAGDLWFGPPEGGLFCMRQGRVVRVPIGGPPDDVVYSIAGDRDAVWVGRQRGGLTRVQKDGADFLVSRLTQADGLPQDSVYAVHRAGDGAVWAATLSAGVSRYKDGVFTTYTRSSGLLSNSAASILETSDGTMWFATANGISTLSRGGWHQYTLRDGLPSNDVNVLFEDSTGQVWAGTAEGLALFNGAQIQTVTAGESLRTAILGIAEDQHGGLWVAAASGVIRLQRDALASGVAGNSAIRLFGVDDGLMSIDGVKRHRSVTTDARRRVWISMGRGLSMVDPARIAGGTLPALVHIEGFSVDGDAVTLAQPVVPPGGRRVSITYAGLSLAVPERVRYQYRLDGFDSEWSAPVTERQAVYTNLSPGDYLFRVVASNSDGAWLGSEAVLRFAVRPRIWQQAWFQASLVIVAVIAGWSLYRLRVYQVSRQLNRRFEERLAERTRIAQELHDTLLQGFVSASMQLHVTADRLPDDSPAKSSLNRVQQLMGRVIEEGRNAVRGLRSPASAPNDLEHVFSTMHQELAAGHAAAYRVISEGRVRVLAPMIRDEVYRIGREAVVNAFRHAQAENIEVELEYGAKSFRLLVRDDGRGVEAQIARTGREGHWGISGMRERAVHIGAAFKLRSRAGAGTEVELAVPGRIAYDRPPLRAYQRWWRRWTGRRIQPVRAERLEHER